MPARLRLIPFLLLLAGPQAFAASTAEMNRQVAQIRTAESIALSPDGHAVAVIVRDSTVAGGLPHLWITAPGAVPKQLGNRAAGQTDPVWTSDGRAVLYLEAGMVRRIDVASGASAAVGPSGLAARGFALARSGALAVWGTDPVMPQGKADQHVFGQAPPVRMMLDDRAIVLPDDVRSATWNSDGNRLLVVTAPASDDLGARNRLWLIASDQPPREIHNTATNVLAASWRADGTIAYYAECARAAPIVCHDVYTQALDGSPPRDLTDGIDGSVMAGPDDGAQTGPLVMRSGDLLVTIARGFDQQVARIAPDGHLSWIDSLPPVVKAIAANDRETGFAMLSAPRGGVVSAQIAGPALAQGAPLPLPDLQPAGWGPLTGRRLTWRRDGLTIEGRLYLPDDTGPDRRVPLVVDVHGGPAGRFEDIDTPLVRLLLHEGYAVLRTNPRGSLGYGTAFLAAARDDLGGGDYRDVMAGVDAALAQAPLDPARLALIGYSYGATIVSFALGRTDRFKAMVATAPVTDQISEYGTEGSSWYDRWYFGQPWRRLDAAWRQSPLSGVASAHTPLLMFHGESDRSNPTTQSYEFYRALRQEGAAVQLVLFPRETHPLIGQNFYGTPSVEPMHGIALRQRMIDFLGDAFAGKPHAGLDLP